MDKLYVTLYATEVLSKVLEVFTKGMETYDSFNKANS